MFYKKKKDFRGEGQLDDYENNFLRFCLGGTDQKETKKV